MTPDFVDPRHALLARAGAWCLLVDHDEMSLDFAFDELVACVDAIAPFKECVVCARRRQNAPKPHPRPTPQTTVEAIVFCVRERGIGALKSPENKARLATCDARARAEINNRIAALGARKGVA